MFFLNDTATTEIYTYGHTLSLHDALPICAWNASGPKSRLTPVRGRQPGTDQTRRRFDGRTPLCGMGVTSRIEVIVKPTACKALSALSRPEDRKSTRLNSSH